MSITLPPPLKPGDLLYAVAPSGTLREQKSFHQGVEIWRSHGYRVEFADNWDGRWGYLAGKDSQRRQALATAWQNPDCRGILCVRGGYGATRLLEDWHWDIGKHENLPVAEKLLPVAQSKWLIGFSDITALLWSLAKVGIGGLHAPLLTTLALEPDWSIDRLFNCVESRPLAPLEGEGWGNGTSRGLIIPANLTVATHLLATPFQPSLQGVILALEDVAEVPYRIDRMLTQWRMMGALEGVKGIALGRFSSCAPPKDIPSLSVEEVLRDRLRDLGIPIVSELPFGHDGPNATLPVGQMVELDGNQGLLRFVV